MNLIIRFSLCLFVLLPFLNAFCAESKGLEENPFQYTLQSIELKGKSFTRKEENATIQLVFLEDDKVDIISDDVKYSGTYSVCENELVISYTSDIEMTVTFLISDYNNDIYLLQWSENDVPMERDIRYYLDN